MLPDLHRPVGLDLIETEAGRAVLELRDVGVEIHVILHPEAHMRSCDVSRTRAQLARFEGGGAPCPHRPIASRSKLDQLQDSVVENYHLSSHLTEEEEEERERMNE